MSEVSSGDVPDIAKSIKVSGNIRGAARQRSTFKYGKNGGGWIQAGRKEMQRLELIISLKRIWVVWIQKMV
jgi:hypothetical protein